MAALLFLLTTFARAQDSQFLFDPNGNLFVQTAAASTPPQILGQPQSRVVAPGEATSFFVVAADTRALTYQWRFNGTKIGGATNDALLRQNVTTNNEGEYRVVLTNPSGSITSAPAMLFIDSDADGLPDSWERTFFGNLTNSATADFDRDGSSNLEEFLNGTDPANSNSVRFRLTVLFDGGSVLKVPDQSSYTNGETVTLTATASSNETFHAWLGDIVTRSNPVSVVMTNNKTVYARFTPSVFTWANPGSGDWNVAANWDPNLAPGLNDSAIVAKSVTVTLNTSVDCMDVTLGDQASAPTLTGSGTLTVRGDLFWTGGTMSGSGRTIIEPGAALIVDNTSSLTLSGRTLENGGTVQFTGSGSLGLISGAVITNRPGAVFNFESEGAFGLGGLGPNGRFDNAGTFRKSAGTGTSTVVSGLSFNNSGAVEIQTGTLALFGGGTHSGSFDVPGGTALILSGNHTADASSAIAGSGQLTFIGGTANLAGLVNVSGSNTFSGGTANFTGNYFANNNTITISGSPGGTANFNGAGVVAPAALNFSGGTLGGSNLVTVLSQMNWSGGTMSSSGRTIIEPGATLNAAIPSLATLSGRTLENGGTVLFTGSGSFVLSGGAVITNRPGAVFNFENEGAFGLGGLVPNGRFDNAGTFRKSAGTGTSTIVSGLGFNNSGTVEIQTGTLSCNGVFTNNGVVNLSGGTTNRLVAGGSATGRFSAPASAQVEWTGGTFTLNAGAQLNGAGLYRLNGGTLTANPNLTVENLDLVHTSSTLGGTGVVTIAGAMNWTAGTMSGSGRTIIPAGVTLNLALSSSAALGTRTLENGGTVLWTGAVFNVFSSAVITNRPGALFRAEGEGANGLGGAVAFGRFDNAGTFRKSAGTGTTTVASGMNFTNYGMVDIRGGILAANGGYVSSSNALLNCALGGTTAGTGYGQLQVGGTVALNGGLSVELINGFVPATNNTFTVLTTGIRSGAFANFFYPSNAVAMQLSNTANSVMVRVTDVFSVPQPAPVPAGLISWWRAEGNALDSIGNNHGVLTNGATFATGQVGQTFALDGTDDFVQVPDSASLRPASVTIEAWVKFFATNGIRIVLVKPLGTGTFDSYGLALQDGAVIASVADNTGFGPFLTGPANTVTGQWYHLAYTFDDTNKQQVLYVNGIPVASGTANKTMSYDAHPVLLGADMENAVLSFFHHGQIDEASLYKRALTRDEIATIYNAGAAGKQLVTTIAQPMLLPPVLTSSNVLLSWTAESNKTYQLEFNPDLGLTNWAALSGDVTTLSNKASKLDALTTSNRFYRVRVLP